jgi:Peptidase family M50
MMAYDALMNAQFVVSTVVNVVATSIVVTILVVGLVWLANLTFLGVHEIGHWLAARLMGLTVISVRVGNGRLLWQGAIGRTTVELRINLIGGDVTVLPDFRGPRAAYAALFLGGSLANIGLGLSLFAASLHMDMNGLSRVSPIILLGVWHVLLGLMNLLPWTSNGVRSDGRMLLDMVTQKPWPGYAEQYAALLSKAGKPISSQLVIERGTPLLMYLLYHESRMNPLRRTRTNALLLSELRKGIGWEPEEVQVLDHLITDALSFSDQANLIAHADFLSERLIGLEPNTPTYWGSRGSVLALLGRWSEARPLLDACLARAKSPSLDSAMCRIALAQCDIGEGRRDAATNHLALARRESAEVSWPPLLDLIAKVEQALTGSTALSSVQNCSSH